MNIVINDVNAPSTQEHLRQRVQWLLRHYRLGHKEACLDVEALRSKESAINKIYAHHPLGPKWGMPSW